MKYGGIKVIDSVLPVDFNDVMTFSIQKTGPTKMALVPKSKLTIFNVSLGNVIDEMM